MTVVRGVVTHDGVMYEREMIDTDTIMTKEQIPGIPDILTRLTALESIAPKRRIRLNITLGAGGTATVTITPTSPAAPFATPPFIDPIITASSTQVFFPVITSVTVDTLVVSGKRSKGTLLLTAGPFEQAATGDVVSLWIIEA